VFVVSFKLYISARNVSNIISSARSILEDAVKATVATEFSPTGDDGGSMVDEESVAVVSIEDETDEMQLEIKQAEEMVDEIGA
jgi:hypothetical protein